MQSEYEDEFEKAFAEASEEGFDEQEPEQPEEEPPEEPEQPEEETREQEEAPDYEALYKREQQLRKTWEGRAKKFQTQQPPAEPPKQAPSAQQPERDPDDEFLEGFRNKYNDDVLKAMEIMSARKARQFISQFEQAYAPLAYNVQDMQTRSHFGAIETAHPDWEQVRDDPRFSEWVDSQPTHRRRAYTEVISGGTPQEVIDLLTDFKDSTSPKTKTPSGRKVQAATAVQVPRGGLAGKKEAAMDDFEAAWREAPDDY